MSKSAYRFRLQAILLTKIDNLAGYSELEANETNQRFKAFAKKISTRDVVTN